MKKYIYSLLTSAILMLAACTDNEVDSVVTLPETEGDAAQLAFTAKDFIPADAQSRTAITGNSFNWIQGDIIGILPDEGAQVYFTIKELSQDAKSAIFTGGAWGLKKANDYTAYYPFIEDIMLNREAVPVDYSEQSYKYQTNTSGDVVVCPSHDYMAAQSEKTTDGESLNFQFSHLGALVKVSFTLPEAAAVKRFYLSSDQPVFPVKGTFDLTPEEGKDVVITPDNDNLARTVAIHVEDLETTSADETVNVYFMMPPMSLVDVDLKATVVYGADDTTLSLRVSKERPTPKDGETEYTQFEAGRSYTLKATADEYLSESFGIAANELSNFINGALAELGGTKLRFVTGSQVASDISIRGSNYEDGTDLYAYAMRNGDWLEVHTSASAVKLFEMANNLFDGLTSTGYYFSFLQEIDLRGLDTQDVTDMMYMFQGCSSLTSITFGENFTTSNVGNMYGMFQDCSSLEELDLSYFNTQSVTDMGRMFFNCSSLESLDLSKFDTSNVTDMMYMFEGCSSLTSITFGENFTASNVGYMYGMFQNCSSLEELDLSNFDTQSVTDMGGMFFNCSSLEELDLSKFDTSNVTDMNNMFYNCSSLESLDLSKFDTSNVTDMSYMFQGCSLLTSITFGENFTTSSVNSMSYMFEGCSSLTSLDLSKFDTSNVTDMSYMFQSCYALTSLDLSGFKFDGNPGCAGMFDGIGENATNKPISIFVTSDGKEYLEGQGTDIDENYAQLVVEAALDGQDGGSW